MATVTDLAKQSAAAGTDGAAARFIAALRARRGQQSADPAPPVYDTKKDAIMRLNMTPEEKKATIEKRIEAEKLIIEEDSRVVEPDEEDRFEDTGGDALAVMNSVLAARTRPELAKLHYADCGEGERRIPKLVFTLDKTTAIPQELDVFYKHSRQFSVQAIQRLNVAASNEFETITNREVRQMLIPPTELWTPILLSILSGPAAPKELEQLGQETADPKRAATITEEEFRSWPMTNELRGVIAAPYLIRYLILAIRAVVGAITNAYSLMGDNIVAKKHAHDVLTAANNAFVEIDGRRAASITKAINECLPHLFVGLRTDEDCPKGSIVPEKIPTFWEAYGTWKTAEDLRAGDTVPLEYAKLPEEERAALQTKMGPSILRRTAIIRFATALQHHAGETSALLCTALIQFISLPASLLLVYGQSCIRLPTRPTSDALRLNSGIDHNWGYDNLVDHIRIMQERIKKYKLAGECGGHNLENLIDQLKAEKQLITGTDPDAPREQLSSGGALSLAYAYYCAVITGVFMPIKKRLEQAELEKRTNKILEKEEDKAIDNKKKSATNGGDK